MPAGNSENAHRLTQRVTTNTAVVFFGQVFSLAASLGVTVLLARHLGQAGFGLFSYAAVFVSLFAIIADFGMQAILVRELSRRQWSEAKILGNAVILKFLLSIVAITFIVASAWITALSSTLFQVIAVLAIGILISPKFLVFRIVFEAPFHASLQMQVPMLLQLLDSLLLLGVAYALTQAGADLETLVIGYSLSNLPGFLLIVYSCVKSFPFRLAIDRELIRFLLWQSFPLLLYTLFMTLFGGVDVLLLKGFQGEGSVGLYSAAMRLVSPLLFIPNVVVSSLLPVLSDYHERSDENFTKAFHLGVKVIILVAVALAIATTFLGAQAIQLLYSSAYGASAGPLITLMWSQAFLFLNFYFANALISVNQQRTTFFAAATMFITSLLANWLLIPVLGISGAAFARLFSCACGFIVLLIAIGRAFTLDLNQFLLRVILLGASFAAGLALMSRVPFILSLFVTVAMFVLLVMITGVFTKDEREIFKSLIPIPIFRK
jgi:O-antigen/teichoic acid export membrane protein